jgi:cell division protease FtsH
VAVTTDDRRIRTTATYLDRGLVGDLIANGVKFDVKPREEGSLLMSLLVSWGPMLAAHWSLDLFHAPNAGWWQRRRL